MAGNGSKRSIKMTNLKGKNDGSGKCHNVEGQKHQEYSLSSETAVFKRMTNSEVSLGRYGHQVPDWSEHIESNANIFLCRPQ